MGLLGDIGHIFGVGADIANNVANRKAQKEMQQAQNEFQSAENAKDRAWQESQWQHQFESTNAENDRRFQQENEEYDRRWNMTNEYNDPKAVMARLTAAGINPAALISQTGSSMMSTAAQAGSPSMPSVGSPGMPGSHGVTPVGYAPIASNYASSIAQLTEAMSSMKQVGLNSRYQEATLASVVRNLDADSTSKEAQAALTSIESDIRALYGKSEAGARVSNLVAQSYMFYSEGNLAKAQKRLVKAQAKVASLKHDMMSEARVDLMTNLKKYGDLLDSDRIKNYAAAEEHRAGAKLKSEQAITESDLREGLVRGQELANGISTIKNALGNIEVQNAVATNPAKLEALLQSYEREKWITDEQVSKALIAAKDRDWQTVEKILSSAESASRTAKNVSSEVRNWANFFIWKP